MSAWPVWAERWPVGEAPAGGELAARVADVLPATDGHLIFWVSADMAPDPLIAALRELCPRLHVWGMTSFGPCAAGLIDHAGFSGIFLPATHVALCGVPFVGDPAGSSGENLYHEIARAERLIGLDSLLNPGKEGFRILFVRHGEEAEEYVAARLHLQEPDIPLVGGTAAPGIDGGPSWCVADGVVHQDANLLIIGRSRTPLRVQHHHHFQPGPRRVVVTGIGENWRCVRRIDGRPARAALAAAFGVDRQALDTAALAVRPLGIRIGDDWFIRSVWDVDGDDLHFASAMAPGTVLTLMEPGDQATALGGVVAQLKQHGLLAALNFSCVGRRIESDSLGTTAEIARVTDGLPWAGGHTFGEQWMGLHLNQTCTLLSFLERN